MGEPMQSTSTLNVIVDSKKCLKTQCIKGVVRIRISKKNRQHNRQKKKIQKNKQRSTKHTHKTKDRVTRTLLKTGG